MTNEEMFIGYLDGIDADSPEPSQNRSHSYRHGFANGRDDLAKRPRGTAEFLRSAAAMAEHLDWIADIEMAADDPQA